MSKHQTSLPEILRRYRPAIVGYLRQLLTHDDAGLLTPMLRYQLGFEDASGQPGGGPAGKLLRPALLLTSCEAVGGDWKRVIPAACAIELVHNFSLVHDDIQDRDEKRHGRPSLWSVWGIAQGINAGDALQMLAGLALHDLALAERDVPEGQIMRVQRMMNEATLRMITGQAQDISFEERLDVKLAEYLEMIVRKTGALMEAACGMGACLGGANEETISAFSAFGERFGLAFQIRDDILGVWGEEARTGKAEANDLVRRKKSLPIVLAFERARGPEREALRAFYRAPLSESEAASAGGIAEIIELLSRLGIDREAEELMRAESVRALQALEMLALPSRSRTRLKELLDLLFAFPAD